MRIKIMWTALMITGVIMISGCNQSDEAKSDEQKESNAPIPVETDKVEKGDFYTERIVNGRVSPSEQTPVMLEQPGEVDSLKVENGDEVEKDDHIATIKTPMGNKYIYAKEAGTIAGLDVQEGEVQSNEDPLMLIIDLEKLNAEFSVTSSIRELLNKDDKVTVMFAKDKYKGKIMAMDMLPNDNGQYPIKAEIDNKDEKVLPGMTAKLLIKEVKAKDALIIPTSSIMNDSDGEFVFMAEDNKAKKVRVEIIETQTEKSAIKGKLNKDDEIITKGQYILQDGNKIEVKEGNEE